MVGLPGGCAGSPREAPGRVRLLTYRGFVRLARHRFGIPDDVFRPGVAACFAARQLGRAQPANVVPVLQLALKPAGTVQVRANVKPIPAAVMTSMSRAPRPERDRRGGRRGLK